MRPAAAAASAAAASATLPAPCTPHVASARTKPQNTTAAQRSRGGLTQRRPSCPAAAAPKTWRESPALASSAQAVPLHLLCAPDTPPPRGYRLVISLGSLCCVCGYLGMWLLVSGRAKGGLSELLILAVCAGEGGGAGARR